LFVTKKRPYASEGHLHLPRDLRPAMIPERRREPAPPDIVPAIADGRGAVLRALGAEQLRTGQLRTGQLRTEPFAKDADSWTAQVLDDALVAYDVRAGDRVVLVRARVAEFGDLVAVADAGEASALRLWRAYPDAHLLRLSTGVHTEARPAATPVAGVLVAVTRRLRPSMTR